MTNSNDSTRGRPLVSLRNKKFNVCPPLDLFPTQLTGRTSDFNHRSQRETMGLSRYSAPQVPISVSGSPGFLPIRYPVDPSRRPLKERSVRLLAPTNRFWVSTNWCVTFWVWGHNSWVIHKGMVDKRLSYVPVESNLYVQSDCLCVKKRFQSPFFRQ